MRANRFRSGRLLLGLAIIVSWVGFLGGPTPTAATSETAVMYRGNPARTGEQSASPHIAIPVPDQSFLDGLLSRDDLSLGSAPACGPKSASEKVCGFENTGASAPVAANGLVYVGGVFAETHSPQGFFALDAGDGQARSFLTTWVVPGPATIVSGVAYELTETGEVFALDIANRSILWISSLNSANFYSDPNERSPLVLDGTVYFGNASGSLIALAATNGTERWRLKLGDWPLTNAAASDGVIVIGSQDGVIYAIDATTGQPRWRTETEGHIADGVAVADGGVYLLTTSGSLEALDLQNGSVRWSEQMRFDKADPSTGVQAPAPAVVDGVVFVGLSGYIDAFDAGTGKSIWSAQLNDGPMSSPSVAAGVVYSVSGSGGLYAIDENSGAQEWHFSTVSQGEQGNRLAVPPAPAVADGRVYFIASDRVLHAVMDGSTSNPAVTPTI